MRSSGLLAPDECNGTPRGGVALCSDYALAVDLAVNPRGETVTHIHNALRVHRQLPPITTPFLMIRVPGTPLARHEDSLDTPA
jgi:hypothetical protein